MPHDQQLCSIVPQSKPVIPVWLDFTLKRDNTASAIVIKSASLSIWRSPLLEKTRSSHMERFEDVPYA